MRTPHTATKKGKRVIVVLRDGTRIRDKFVERTQKFVFLETHGRIDKGDIRSFQIDRNWDECKENKLTSTTPSPAREEIKVLTPFLCIGGPLDGKTGTFEDVKGQNYTPFNCGYKCSRTKLAHKRAKERGETIPPSMVWIHSSIFGDNHEESE